MFQKIRGIPLSISLLVTTYLFLGCSSAPYFYKGDGDFDNRIFAPAYAKYRLELGTFNSSIATSETFQVGELPEEPFQFVLLVSDHNPDGLRRQTVAGGSPQLANLRLRVACDQSDEVIVDKVGPLTDWQQREVTLNRTRFGGVKQTKDGWASYRAFYTADHRGGSSVPGAKERFFIPTPDHTYTVLFEISNPDDLGIEVILEGSGGPLTN